MIEITETTEKIIQILSTEVVPPTERFLRKELRIPLKELHDQIALLRSHDVAEFKHTSMSNFIQKMSNFEKVIQAGGLTNFIKSEKDKEQNLTYNRSKTNNHFSFQTNSGMNEIKELIGEGDLKKAIDRSLDLLPDKENYHSDLTLLRGSLSSLNEEYNGGRIDFQNKQLAENRISKALSDMINKYEQKLLVQEPLRKEEPDNPIISTCETIYKISEKILQENQKTLLPVFKSDFDRTEVTDAVASLYHQQNERGDFSRWLTYLAETNEKINDNDVVKGLIGNLIQETNTFTDKLYRKHQDLSKSLVYDKLREETIPVDEVKLIVENYLEFLRERRDKIGAIVEKIRLHI